MTEAEVRTRVLLLVEDNPGDARLVEDLLEETATEHYQVLHAPRMQDALARLSEQTVDVVVLDLQLPDCSGVESVKAMRAAAGETPIVVLTSSDDEALALSCINAGAHDYLPKSEVRSKQLKRSIGYAITRQREAQLRDLMQVLERYRSLSSATQSTTVTAALAGSGAIAIRSPETFSKLSHAYSELLTPYLGREGDRRASPKDEMSMLVTALGDCGGGPRDLLDVHVAALDRVLANGDASRSSNLVFESRLLALEMMGLLVDYYRVGQRRRFVERETP